MTYEQAHEGSAAAVPVEQPEVASVARRQMLLAFGAAAGMMGLAAVQGGKAMAQEGTPEAGMAGMEESPLAKAEIRIMSVRESLDLMARSMEADPNLVGWAFAAFDPEQPDRPLAIMTCQHDMNIAM